MDNGVDNTTVYGAYHVHGADGVYGANNTNITESSGMINMLDIGGNYGRVAIAAFMNHPETMRVIAVEPVPSTYLLLRWNLWLNGVPELTEKEFEESPTMPGVVALQFGISSVDWSYLNFCTTPPFTKEARICNCTDAQPDEQCQEVVSRTIESLVKMFHDEKIALLKMDCKGCNVDVVSSLAQLSATVHKIGRFAGKLHALPNEVEDLACKFEGGKWFVHKCFANGIKETLTLQERCQAGAARKSCSQ